MHTAVHRSDLIREKDHPRSLTTPADPAPNRIRMPAPLLHLLTKPHPGLLFPTKCQPAGRPTQSKITRLGSRAPRSRAPRSILIAPPRPAPRGSARGGARRCPGPLIEAAVPGVTTLCVEKSEFDDARRRQIKGIPGIPSPVSTGKGAGGELS
jgi:hypothetical protein